MMGELASEKIMVEDSVQAVNKLFYERGWTDGLPIIPPTEEEVWEMLKYVDRDPQDVIATLPLKFQPANVEKIAINAVMAGCLPEYMPVVIAAVEAVADPEFGLYSVQATTHPCSPLLVINGPVRHKLDINSGAGAFGPGWRANATIGRAIRLILINIGGAIPAQLDMSTQAQPSKYTYCIGENEEENPWVPLHVERGFDISDSTVTTIAAEGPHNMLDHASTTARGILKMAAATMAKAGGNNTKYPISEPILALGPEHAATIAADGLSKDDVKDYLFENARVPLHMLSEENILEVQKRREIYGDCGDRIPIARDRNDIMVIVVGGAGKHSSFIPTFGVHGGSVTKRIQFPDSFW